MSKELFTQVIDNLQEECNINQDTYKVAKAYSDKVLSEYKEKLASSFEHRKTYADDIGGKHYLFHDVAIQIIKNTESCQ